MKPHLRSVFFEWATDKSGRETIQAFSTGTQISLA